ncbi:MAG: hypothetical protein RJQ21_02525 [Rhodospirillales bacterium]
MAAALLTFVLAGCQTSDGNGRSVPSNAAATGQKIIIMENGKPVAVIENAPIVGAYHQATLAWSQGKQSATMGLYWDEFAFDGTFWIFSHPSGLGDCTGKITRRFWLSNWQVNCDGGETFKGTIQFYGAPEIKGTGADRQGAVATLTLRR